MPTRPFVFAVSLALLAACTDSTSVGASADGGGQGNAGNNTGDPDPRPECSSGNGSAGAECSTIFNCSDGEWHEHVCDADGCRCVDGDVVTPSSLECPSFEQAAAECRLRVAANPIVPVDHADAATGDACLHTDHSTCNPAFDAAPFEFSCSGLPAPCDDLKLPDDDSQANAAIPPQVFDAAQQKVADCITSALAAGTRAKLRMVSALQLGSTQYDLLLLGDGTAVVQERTLDDNSCSYSEEAYALADREHFEACATKTDSEQWLACVFDWKRGECLPTPRCQ